MKKVLFVLFGAVLHTLYAQNANTSASFSEMEAFESFQARKYESVIGNLKSQPSRSGDEEILLLLSEMKTGKRDAAKVEQWLTKNDKHPIKPLVAYHLGEYYYYKRDTVESKNYLKTISASSLSTSDKASYGFIYGMLQLEDGNYENAKDLFQLSRRSAFSDLNKLDYYEAYANYHVEDEDAALAGFDKTKNSEAYGTSSRFFIAKIRLDNGEVDEVISLAKEELSDEQTVTNSGFYQLVGEAYALKGDVAKADAYFERAIELHPGKPTAALYYQAGVSKFKIGNEDQAIEYLKESGIQGGEYAYLSAFQLGRLYLKKQKYEDAIFAYIEASASDDQMIKEEAFYQAARINVKLGNYTEAINYATDYLDTYKNGEKRGEIQDLIAQSYLRTSNYDLAITHLKNTGINNATQKDIYQKVTFQKAILSFNDGAFVASKKWFDESLRYTPNLSLKNQAYFHLGEIAIRAGDYNDALDKYQSQSEIDVVTNYGIGYAYYNQQKYERAVSYFKKAVNATDLNMRMDARVRLADCLFATKSYNEALSNYKQVSSKTGSTYISFQIGNVQKSMGKGEEAVQSFQKVFNSPAYGATARFESGMIYFESARFDKAESFFSQVIDTYPDSKLHPEALLNRGVARKNMGKMIEAKADYTAILENYLTSEVALNAILGLQELQQAGVEIKKLDQFIADYKKANPESGSLELIEFESAKRLYFDFAYAAAAEAFDQYLKDYPTSNNKIEAKYYLGDAYYRIDQLEQSKEVFDDLKYIRNTYTGRTLYRLGDINRRLDNIAESEDAYKLLKDLDLSAKDTYNARQGLMMLYFNSKQFTNAITIADEIIKADWKPLNAEKEAIMVKAKSFLSLNNLATAKTVFEKLADGQDIYGAEANYFTGLIEYNQEQYEESLNTLFDLNAKYGSYQDWVDRSYLLIAKNYIAQEELFQAKATLRSIIQHAKNEEVKSESSSLLKQIEQNTSVSDTTQSKG